VWSCGVDEGEGKAATARFNAVGSWCFGSSRPEVRALRSCTIDVARFAGSLGRERRDKSALCAQAGVSDFDVMSSHDRSRVVYEVRERSSSQTVSACAGAVSGV
jgi:hypothetical protein